MGKERDVQPNPRHTKLTKYNRTSLFIFFEIPSLFKLIFNMPPCINGIF